MDFGVRTLWNKTKTVLSHELHANTSPIKISLSLAIGVLVGFSPFYGIHTIIVLALAFLLRLNRPIALLGSGVTLLPFVPLWIAAGIVTGKMVAPVETASRIIDNIKSVMASDEQFWGITSAVVNFCRRIFPSDVFDKVDEEASHGILDGFVQWAIGCSVFAVATAILTFAVSYLIFWRVAAVRHKKMPH
jgi:hypothetical protein